MNILQKIFGTGQNNESQSLNRLITPETCPNCWGKQEYGGHTDDSGNWKTFFDKTFKKAFVMKFVEKNVTGIRGRRNGFF